LDSLGILRLLRLLQLLQLLRLFIRWPRSLQCPCRRPSGYFRADAHRRLRRIT
jgi:hypothetical protein